MNRRRLTLVLLALLATAVLPLSGCSKRYKITIEADKCWTGTINNEKGIAGCGNSSYTVIGALGCVELFKTGTGPDPLRVRIDSGPWSQTTDPNGRVKVCR